MLIGTAERSAPAEGFGVGGSQHVCMPVVNPSDYSAVKESKSWFFILKTAKNIYQTALNP